MEQNKYYTPDIEDIRVGYECEVFGVLPNIPYPRKKEEGWFKFSIVDIIQPAMRKIISDKEIRTPYLTKEQIEAEGWEIKYNHDVLVGFQKGEGMYPVLVEYNTESHHLTIRTGSWYPEETIYYGKCPSINEFRTICKLLNIK